MALVKQQRRFKIGPIGVARVSRAGTTVAGAVRDLADGINREAVKIAASEAQESGKKLAAEANVICLAEFKVATPPLAFAPLIVNVLAVAPEV